MPLWLDSKSSNFTVTFSKLLSKKREFDQNIEKEVSTIIEKIQNYGDAALIEYTQKFDHLNLSPKTILVSEEEIDEGFNACDQKTLKALDFAHKRITKFHQQQIPENLTYVDDAGLTLGYQWNPVDAAGLYVPGGTAAYPSSVLMNAIPAQVAGVRRLVIVTPSPQGKLNPLVMAAIKLLGVKEVYRIGGAQAVAALAFGTETISPVDKIVGPGNTYVASAKKQVFGKVGIDVIAGPSEILIIADGANEPSWIAMDLLAQAEHDTLAQAILITDDSNFADHVANGIDAHLQSLPRASIAERSWVDHGAVIIVDNLEEAAMLANQIAPEHLEIATEYPEKLVPHIKNAGAIFLGRYSPEAIGDYVAGPNHVLPTSGSAKFSSGLSTLDFMKRTSLISCGIDGLRNIGPSAMSLAQAEGLDAHARSISIRLNLSD